MRHLFSIAFMLKCATICAQDTLCVMITLSEVIEFNYQTSTVTNRTSHEGDFEIKVKEGEVMCLHLCDEKKRYRDVTTTFGDGDHIHNTFDSFDNSIYTRENWGDITIHISEARRKKRHKEHS